MWWAGVDRTALPLFSLYASGSCEPVLATEAGVGVRTRSVLSGGVDVSVDVNRVPRPVVSDDVVDAL
jgi:hypothetical protein